jgi:hypothetical protein
MMRAFATLFACACTWESGASSPTRPAFASSLEAFRHPRVSGPPGPGTYAHYALPSVPAGVEDMEHAVVWIVEPPSSETHGNAVFASTQMWHLGGPGGYIGSQRWRNADGTMSSKAIFSMWDASADVMTGWVGPNCERFGGEGTGSHCTIEYELVTNNTYVLKYAHTGTNSSGAMWSGTITDMRSSKATKIGTLFYPNFGATSGYGALQVVAASFVEYFLADGCDGEAQSGIGMLGPLFSNLTIRPTQATGDYAGGPPPCLHSNVNGCIPGLTCGEPKVYHTLGGAVQRLVPAGTPLW